MKTNEDTEPCNHALALMEQDHQIHLLEMDSPGYDWSCPLEELFKFCPRCGEDVTAHVHERVAEATRVAEAYRREREAEWIAAQSTDTRPRIGVNRQQTVL